MSHPMQNRSFCWDVLPSQSEKLNQTQQKQTCIGNKIYCNIKLTQTRWLYCVECTQYRIQLEAIGYLCTSCLLPAFDEAYCHLTQQSMVIGCVRLSDVSIICHVVNPRQTPQKTLGGFLYRVYMPGEWRNVKVTWHKNYHKYKKSGLNNFRYCDLD